MINIFNQNSVILFQCSLIFNLGPDISERAKIARRQHPGFNISLLERQRQTTLMYDNYQIAMFLTLSQWDNWYFL